jgi:predicted signal transduction protein with EAL and GGDEF domain
LPLVNMSVSERLFENMARTTENKGISEISCRIGIALWPQDANNPVELELMADSAMYRAKQIGKSKAVFLEVSKCPLMKVYMEQASISDETFERIGFLVKEKESRIFLQQVKGVH